MKVLGLDPSLTAYGWAVHETGESGKARCIARGRLSTSSSTLFLDRYIFMRETLTELLRTTLPDCVGIESPFFGGSYSEGMYGLFLYSNEALKAAKKDVVYFSPGQVKAHARETLGRPDGWKMEKPDMCEAAKKDVGGGKAWNHNEADAYLVARLAGRFWGYAGGAIPEAELSPVERKLFAEVHVYVRGARAGEVEKRGLTYREGDRFFRWSKLGVGP